MKQEQWKKIFRENTLVNEDKNTETQNQIKGVRRVGVHVENIAKELDKIYKIVKNDRDVQSDCIDIVGDNFGGSVVGSDFGYAFGRFEWESFGPRVLKAYKNSAKDMKKFTK